MGNCTSSDDMKGQAFDAKRVQGTYAVKRELRDMFEEKKSEDVKDVREPVRQLAVDEEHIKTVPQLADRLQDAVAIAADAVSGAAESADESESMRHQGIAALRRISPSSSGLSLLHAAGETRAEAEGDEADVVGNAGDAQDAEEALRDEPGDAFVDAVAEAAADAVSDNSPKVRFASELVVDTESEPQAAETTARELQCESPASPLSPAAWVADESTKVCQCCGSNFTFVRRRHHCRACGEVVCNGCSTSRKVLADMGHSKPVRCCDSCV